MDRRPLGSDPGLVPAMDAAAQWIARAQDESASRDGGVARDYSLLHGWATSYPETTGYIVPTMIRYGQCRQESGYIDRARRMLDWLVKIQLGEGAFQGGRIDSEPRVPVVFNTGQILIGLAAGGREFGEPYLTSMHRAATWLMDAQDPDGCWRRGASPFAMAGEKTYDTHVAWGLVEAYRTQPTPEYLDAALRNVHWAVGHQRENGWVDKCCLTNTELPLTHTLGYALRGIIETHLESQDEQLLAPARRLADGLLSAMQPSGFLPGRLDSRWQGAVSWACLTGCAQIAACWLILYRITDETLYLDAALTANRFVRRTMKTEGHAGVKGGVKGSHPIDGEYGRFEYLNWAAKFLIDSLIMEHETLRRAESMPL
jgi:hypothetical protein